ncbi:MAG: hypothetical protein IPH35_06140 [Rhodoferax sp.]|nr:hypothetical protein [Rhodoferax sp.]
MTILKNSSTATRCFGIALTLTLLCTCQRGLTEESVKSAVNAPDHLGTLFYSASERQEIRQSRQLQSGASLGPTPPTTVHLQGVASTRPGKATAWVNGQALSEREPDAPKILGVDAVLKGQRLRVGESLDLTSGIVHDVVAPGAVVSGPSKTPKTSKTSR